MGDLLSYTLEIGMMMLPLWILYRLLMSRTTFYRFNRFTILFIYAISLISPFIRLSFGEQSLAVVELMPIEWVVTESVEVQDGSISILSVLLNVYIVGFVLSASYFLISLLRLSILILKSKKIKCDGYIIAIHENNNLVPFSWCRWIIMNEDDYKGDVDVVLMHELAHLRKLHCVDLIFAQLVVILNWYNPIVWILRDELQVVHEYEADKVVLDSGVNPMDYQLLLIKKTVGARFASIANSLNHNSLKKRITMMLSKKTNGRARMRALALVPAVALVLVGVKTPMVASTLGAVSSASVQVYGDKDSENLEKEQVFKAAEQMPQFPGGYVALNNFLAQNLRYPEKAMSNKTEGTVVVQFEVMKTGKIGNVKVVRKVDAELEAEAVRVVKSMPDFIPGKINGNPVNVMYTLPIMFKLPK